jgi:hypothetical protein
MKKIAALLGFTLVTTAIPQQPVPPKNPTLHTFKYWGLFETQTQKRIFLNRFTNGLFKAPRSDAFFTLRECVEQTDMEQIIAMIDKYYKDNPEKWNLAVGAGIISAITVTGGPCSGMSP